MVHRHPLIVNPSDNQIQELNENTDTLVGGIPLGGIIMWSGNASSTSVPTGFVLCDGNASGSGAAINGITIPDLRNRFIIGANQVDSGVWKGDIETNGYSGSNIAKQSGGFKNAVLFSHSHTTNSIIETGSNSAIDLSGTVGKISETYATSGTATGVFQTDPPNEQSAPNTPGNPDSSPCGAFSMDVNHRHGTDTIGKSQNNSDSTTQTGNNANLPPYFALAYIIRVS